MYSVWKMQEGAEELVSIRVGCWADKRKGASHRLGSGTQVGSFSHPSQAEGRRKDLRLEARERK